MFFIRKFGSGVDFVDCVKIVGINVFFWMDYIDLNVGVVDFILFLDLRFFIYC